jgi:prolyl-tRNA synthetase
MGGSESVEFMAASDAGEDWVVHCPGCRYAANLEKAKSVPSRVEDPDDRAAPEKFATPGVRTIEELERFPGGAPANRQIKTLVYVVGGEPMLFLLRGDHELCDVKLVEATGTTQQRPAHPEEIGALLGAAPGSLGGLGVVRAKVWIDEALRGRRGMTTGANENGFHVRHVDVTRDLGHARFADLRNVVAGDACTACGKPLELRKSIEVGHIFKLGTHYSQSMGATVQAPDGKQIPIVMGCYGIGIDRIAAAAIEAHHDENGIAWPISIAPFHVVLTPVKASDPAQAQAGEALCAELEAAGLEVLYDDRDERAGVKFKDADLVGVPIRIAVGKKGLAGGNVEWKLRARKEVELVPAAEVARKAAALVRAG